MKTCYACNQPGHIARNCQANLQPQECQSNDRQLNQPSNEHESQLATQQQEVPEPSPEVPKPSFTMTSTYDPSKVCDHDMMNWTFCYDDNCLVHYSAKIDGGWFPVKTKNKPRARKRNPERERARWMAEAGMTEEMMKRDDETQEEWNLRNGLTADGWRKEPLNIKPGKVRDVKKPKKIMYESWGGEWPKELCNTDWGFEEDVTKEPESKPVPEIKDLSTNGNKDTVEEGWEQVTKGKKKKQITASKQSINDSKWATGGKNTRGRKW